MSATGIVVSALYVYPVKSCRGIALDQAEVVRRGFARDRRWMVVDDDGHFLTQRETPALGQVRTTLEAGGIRLDYPGKPALELPEEYERGQSLAVRVWSHSGIGVRHADGSDWLSRALGQRCSLVFMPERHQRAVNPERARAGDIVSFADGYPFLLTSEASLEDLNARLPARITMQRFRPNIVVSGAPAYAEDEWARVRIGEIDFRGAKRCDRCVVTTRDPETGEASTEPLRTLATYRKWDGAVWFGMNLIHDQPGWVKVGDSVSPGA